MMDILINLRYLQDEPFSVEKEVRFHVARWETVSPDTDDFFPEVPTSEEAPMEVTPSDEDRAAIFGLASIPQVDATSPLTSSVPVSPTSISPQKVPAPFRLGPSSLTLIELSPTGPAAIASGAATNAPSSAPASSTPAPASSLAPASSTAVAAVDVLSAPFPVAKSNKQLRKEERTRIFREKIAGKVAAQKAKRERGRTASVAPPSSSSTAKVNPPTTISARPDTSANFKRPKIPKVGKQKSVVVVPTSPSFPSKSATVILKVPESSAARSSSSPTSVKAKPSRPSSSSSSSSSSSHRSRSNAEYAARREMSRHHENLGKVMNLLDLPRAVISAAEVRELYSKVSQLQPSVGHRSRSPLSPPSSSSRTSVPAPRRRSPSPSKKRSGSVKDRLYTMPSTSGRGRGRSAVPSSSASSSYSVNNPPPRSLFGCFDVRLAAGEVGGVSDVAGSPMEESTSEQMNDGSKGKGSKKVRKGKGRKK